MPFWLNALGCVRSRTSGMRHGETHRPEAQGLRHAFITASWRAAHSAYWNASAACACAKSSQDGESTRAIGGHVALRLTGSVGRVDGVVGCAHPARVAHAVSRQRTLNNLMGIPLDDLGPRGCKLIDAGLQVAGQPGQALSFGFELLQVCHAVGLLAFSPASFSLEVPIPGGAQYCRTSHASDRVSLPAGQCLEGGDGHARPFQSRGIWKCGPSLNDFQSPPHSTGTPSSPAQALTTAARSANACQLFQGIAPPTSGAKSTA